MVLLQTAVTFVFMQHHWDLVTRRLSEAVARDVGALTDLYRSSRRARTTRSWPISRPNGFAWMRPFCRRDPLPPAMPRSFFGALDPLTRTLPNEIKTQVREPFWVDTVGRSGLMEIRVDLGDRVLRLVTRRALAYEANAHIFVLWMLGAMMVLLAVAIIFLRNQIRPILRLARAAEDFGKGRDLDFSPHGAREVRQAGYAFIEMKRRIERATEQRTAMLNGVSHDLRTILTRFKLSLAVARQFRRQRAAAEGRRRDGPHARGLSRLRPRRRQRTDRHDRHRRPCWRICAPTPSATAPTFASRPAGDLDIRCGRMAMKRCIGNLVANAQRHADHVEISAKREPQFVSIDRRRRRHRHPARASRGCFPALLPARRGAQPGPGRRRSRPRDRPRHRPLARRRHHALEIARWAAFGRPCGFRLSEAAVGGSDGGADPAGQLALRARAGLGGDVLAVLEHHQRRDRTDADICRRRPGSRRR